MHPGLEEMFEQETAEFLDTRISYVERRMKVDATDSAQECVTAVMQRCKTLKTYLILISGHALLRLGRCTCSNEDSVERRTGHDSVQPLIEGDRLGLVMPAIRSQTILREPGPPSPSFVITSFSRSLTYGGRRLLGACRTSFLNTL